MFEKKGRSRPRVSIHLESSLGGCRLIALYAKVSCNRPTYDGKPPSLSVGTVLAPGILSLMIGAIMQWLRSSPVVLSHFNHPPSDSEHVGAHSYRAVYRPGETVLEGFYLVIWNGQE